MKDICHILLVLHAYHTLMSKNVEEVLLVKHRNEAFLLGWVLAQAGDFVYSWHGGFCWIGFISYYTLGTTQTRPAIAFNALCAVRYLSIFLFFSVTGVEFS